MKIQKDKKIYIISDVLNLGKIVVDEKANLLEFSNGKKSYVGETTIGEHFVVDVEAFEDRSAAIQAAKHICSSELERLERAHKRISKIMASLEKETPQ